MTTTHTACTHPTTKAARATCRKARTAAPLEFLPVAVYRTRKAATTCADRQTAAGRVARVEVEVHNGRKHFAVEVARAA